MADSKKVINLDEDDGSTFTFSLVVKADKWDDVITILKDTLGVTQKLNSSNRDINGLFLVSCWFKAEEITKDFYKKIERSDSISIHSDGKSSSLYPQILKEVQAIEERLRWLLLHVSDTIENYLELVNAKTGVVTTKSLDPITANLTLEKTIDLLGFDQSWNDRPITATDVARIAANSSNFAEFKKSFTEKTTPKTIWDSITELVLDTPVAWHVIEPKLGKVKVIRNKCAHFHTVTDDDLSQIKKLRTDIIKALKTTKRASAGKKDYEAFNLEFMKSLNDIINTKVAWVSTLAQLSAETQKSLSLLSGISESIKPITTNYKGILDSINIAPISPLSGLIDHNVLLRLQQLDLNAKKDEDAGDKK